MNPKRLLLGATAAVLAASLLSVSMGSAQQEPSAPVTPDQARAAAVAAVPGTVLEVEREAEGGRTVYEVEVRPTSGGPVVEVLVDASSGAVLSTAGDDNDWFGDIPGMDDD